MKQTATKKTKINDFSKDELCTMLHKALNIKGSIWAKMPKSELWTVCIENKLITDRPHAKQQIFIAMNEDDQVMSIINSLPEHSFNDRLSCLISEHYSADETEVIYTELNRNGERMYTATIQEDGNDEREEIITLIPVAEY